jgi:hypothetical protein
MWNRLTPCTASVGSLAIGEVVLGETDNEVELQTYIGTENEGKVLVPSLWYRFQAINDLKISQSI